MSGTIPPAEALRLASLITPTEQAIASRVLARTSGGTLTLLACDRDQELTEHTSPYEAFILVVEGQAAITIGGRAVLATPGTIVRLPAHVPHAVRARSPARLLVMMLRGDAPT